MLFSQNKNESNKTNQASEKKRSLWGTLFNPDLGSDIRPLRESMSMFVRLIALILATNKLFPKDHPALTDTSASLTLGEVFAISKSRVKWTKEDLPQMILFIAVWGCLLFSALFVATFVLSLFVGAAHAQTTTGTTTSSGSMFQPPDSNCDLAQLWINYLFLGKDISTSTACNDALTIVPQSQLIQTALQSALSTFSSGILVFAGIILIYHLLVMIAETAHSGKPMGRANQIWAPIRLVVAIGLLVPIGTASSTGASGLNAGQFIVVQMAKWGSGFASYTWVKFLDALTQQMDGMTLNAPPAPVVGKTVKDIVSMAACKSAWNQMVQVNGYPSTFWITLHESYPNCKGGSCVKYDYRIDDSRVADISCGSILFDPASSGTSTGTGSSAQLLAIAKKLQDAVLDSTKSMISDSNLSQAADGIFSKMPTTYQGDTTYTDDQIIASVNSLQSSYKKNIENAIKQAVSSQNGEWKANLSAIKTNWANQGWVTAGAWFNTIARAQGAAFSAADVGMPSTAPKSLFGLTDYLSYIAAPRQTAKVKEASDVVSAALAAYNTDILQKVDAEPLPGSLSNSTASFGSEQVNNPATNSLVKAVLEAIDWIGTQLGVWPTGDQLAFTFGQSSNPLAELAYRGFTNLNLGLTIIAYAGLGAGGAAMATGTSVMVGGAAPALMAGPAGVAALGGIALITAGFVAALVKAAGALLGLAIMVGAIFVATGVILAYMLPLIPFIRFFFNVLTWIITLFEAIVSAPLFALAHLSPYGEGLPGQMAQRGYFFIFGIFLRPVLTLFGLVAGLLMFFIAINFLNMTFGIASAGTGSVGGSLAVVGKIVFSVIYAGLAYICANTCFKSIGYFPEHALNWMNASGAAGKEMGDKALMGNLIAGASGFLGNKVGGTLKEVGAAAGDLPGSLGKSFMDAKTQRETARIGQQRQNQLMQAQGYVPTYNEKGKQTGYKKALGNANFISMDGGPSPSAETGGKDNPLPPPSDPSSGGAGSNQQQNQEALSKLTMQEQKQEDTSRRIGDLDDRVTNVERDVNKDNKTKESFGRIYAGSDRSQRGPRERVVFDNQGNPIKPDEKEKT